MTTESPAASQPNRAARLAVLFLAGALAVLLAGPADAAPPISAAEAEALAAITPPVAALDPPAGHLTAHLFPAGTAGSVAPMSDPATGSRIQGVLRRAFALLGTPYRWGGSSPERGFDCSGLVGYVYRTALGIELPRISRDQARTGEQVADRAAMAAGDLVFFGRRGRVDHVGIYIGEGKFVHAPSRGKDVMVSSLDEGYWGGKFLQARRIAL